MPQSAFLFWFSLAITEIGNGGHSSCDPVSGRWPCIDGSRYGNSAYCQCTGLLDVLRWLDPVCDFNRRQPQEKLSPDSTHAARSFDEFARRGSTAAHQRREYRRATTLNRCEPCMSRRVRVMVGPKNWELAFISPGLVALDVCPFLLFDSN